MARTKWFPPVREQGEGLADYIPRVIRAWDQWSPAESADGLVKVVEDIMRHVRTGHGGPRCFAAWWCKVVLEKHGICKKG
jgi:hypothetical protein